MKVEASKSRCGWGVGSTRLFSVFWKSDWNAKFHRRSMCAVSGAGFTDSCANECVDDAQLSLSTLRLFNPDANVKLNPLEFGNLSVYRLVGTAGNRDNFNTFDDLFLSVANASRNV